MRKLYALAILILPFAAWAQQDAQFTQFMYNKAFYNAGYPGSNSAICANLYYRTQWVGFEGAPVTQNFNLTAPIKLLHGGVHLGITNDVIGFYQNTNFNVGYAYQTKLGGGTLGIGANLMIGTRSTNALWVPAEFGPGGFMDPSIVAPDAQSVGIDANFGVYYSTPKFWGGLSTTRVIEAAAETDANIGGIIGTSTSTLVRNARHYYLMGGYNYALAGTNWELQPALLLKTDLLSSPIADVNLTAVYNNKMWGGVTYRLQDAVAINLGYELFEGFRAGYSYDFTTSNLSGGSAGSHEVMLSYCFNITIPEREKAIFRNPRFL